MIVSISLLAVLGFGFLAIDRQAATGSRPSASAGTVSFEERPAIAVLPFESISANNDRSFIANGLAEDPIVRLSSWRAFPVIARNSSFKYRGSDFDLRTLGAELGVRYVVSGSVRHDDDRIRVTAQLIEAESGQYLWADKYDRELNDVFALQDEISSTIAASLIVDLSRAEGERAHQRATDNLEAWGAHHIGLQHFDRYTLEGFARAREIFERAVELDPRFATALGQIAVAGQSELMLGYTGDRQQLVERMTDRARRAVELDARDPTAHLGLAVAHIAVTDTRNGLDSVRRALDLNPSMPEAWIWLGWIQLLDGDPQSAVTSTERARRLDPKGNLVWVFDSLSAAYWELGRYAEGLAAGERLVALEPSYFPGYAWIAMNSVGLGREDDARAALGQAKAPALSIQAMQDYFGVSRPEIDQRRNATLRSVGLQ